MLNEDNSFCCSPIIDVVEITYLQSFQKNILRFYRFTVKQLHFACANFREVCKSLVIANIARRTAIFFFLRMFVMITRLWMNVLLPKLVVANSFIPGKKLRLIYSIWICFVEIFTEWFS